MPLLLQMPPMRNLSQEALSSQMFQGLPLMAYGGPNQYLNQQRQPSPFTQQNPQRPVAQSQAPTGPWLGGAIPGFFTTNAPRSQQQPVRFFLACSPQSLFSTNTRCLAEMTLFSRPSMYNESHTLPRGLKHLAQILYLKEAMVFHDDSLQIHLSYFTPWRMEDCQTFWAEHSGRGLRSSMWVSQRVSSVPPCLATHPFPQHINSNRLSGFLPQQTYRPGAWLQTGNRIIQVTSPIQLWPKEDKHMPRRDWII